MLLHNAPLNNPKDVAFFLASYARDARVRVEAARDLPALNAVRAALEEALGMKFEADKGEHFFRSTLVQTLFYGVFSAWVLWHKENVAPASRLRVHEASSPRDSERETGGGTPPEPAAGTACLRRFRCVERNGSGAIRARSEVVSDCERSGVKRGGIAGVWQNQQPAVCDFQRNTVERKVVV